MKKPVKHGDTIYVRTTVTGKRETSQPDRGVVTFARAFVNQHGQEVQEMEVTIMYRRRPPG
jgi:acyl dehydratase